MDKSNYEVHEEYVKRYKDERLWMHIKELSEQFEPKNATNLLISGVPNKKREIA